jgi:DNA polymerase-4
MGHPSATLLASDIRYHIKKEVGLDASAGISVNKFTAKIASDINKPNGQKTIPPEEVLSFLEQLPIRKFFGVGKVTADKMKLHGIHYGMDLKQFSNEYLREHFGKSGGHFYNIVRGIQHSEVKPDRIRKSIAAERTLDKDISQEIFMLEHLERIAETLESRMKKSKVNARTITLKLKYSDFTTHTRSKTIDSFVSNKEDFFPIVKELLVQEPVKSSVRLLGISMSKLDAENPPEKVLDEQLEMGF